MNRSKISLFILLNIFLCVGLSYSQINLKPLIVGQGMMMKYDRYSRFDYLFGASVTGGVVLYNHLGLGVNVQAIDWGPKHRYYVPVNFEASYFNQRKFSPYFNVQVGKGFYRKSDVYSIPSFTSISKTIGGLYFSPGVGLLFPIFKKTKGLLTFSYIRSGFKDQISIVNDPTPPYTAKYTLQAFRVGLGIKL